MPKLNEYLGGLVSEIVSARKMADLQTVQTAKEYAQDDLLKHFSVPRMKVSSVDLTVPFAHAGVALKKSFKEFVYDEITSVMKTDYDYSDTKNDQYLKDFLTDLELDYQKTVMKMKIAVAAQREEAKELREKAEATESIKAQESPIRKGLFDDFSQKVVLFCQSLENFNWKKADSEMLSLSLINRMIKEYENDIKEEGIVEENEVIVEANQLMKIDSKYLVYAKMTITEAGMEWSNYENMNGDVVKTLIPE